MRDPDIAFLVDRYQGVLFAIACSRLKDPYEAKEAVADSFVQAYLSLRSLRDFSKFGPWIRTILHNICLGKLRHRQTSTSQIDTLGACPQDRLVLAEDTNELLTALNEVSAISREAVVLHYWFAFSISDLANWLGIPEGTVKRRLHDARKTLRETLKEPPSSFDLNLQEEIAMEIKKKEIPETQIEYANMQGSHIAYVGLEESKFENVDFSRSRFSHINIHGTTFQHAGGANGSPASNLCFKHCTMKDSSFENVDMSGSHLRNVNLEGVRMDSCGIKGLTIDGIDIEELVRKAKESK